MRTRGIGGIAMALVVAASTAAAGDCRYEDVRDGSAPAAGAAGLVVDAGPGSLRVVGVEGITEVRASGRACADSEDVLAAIELVVRSGEGRVTVETRFPEGGWGHRGEVRLDLTVEVPPGFAVEVDDGSGDLTIANVASARVEDGSGEVEISEIAGDVVLDDGSGEIRVRRVKGSVRIDDGSGEIEVVQVDRDVVIDGDGSGDIGIAIVGGNVLIDDDGSGDIDVRDVTGRFEVRSDGSGDIRYDRVAGGVQIPRRHDRG